MDASRAPEGVPPSSPRDAFREARHALRRAAKLIEASMTLLRAELKLARSSAMLLAGLAVALLFLAMGAWLAVNAAIAAAVYELSGNVFYGVAVAFLVNITGMIAVVLIMRRCARDVSMPRTRRMFGRLGKDADGNT